MDAAADSFGDLPRKPQGHFLSDLSSLVVLPLSSNDDQADQRGCSKENSWWWSPLLLPYLYLFTPLICTLNIWTPPTFIHANLSLSRRIYICCCGAKLVSRFICAEFIGSSLLSCFGLCVVSEMPRVKCLGACLGHRVNLAGSAPIPLWLTQSVSVFAGLCICVPARVLMHVCTSAHECQVSLRCLCWCSQSLPISADPGSHHCSLAANHPCCNQGPDLGFSEPSPLQMIPLLIGLTGLLSVAAD